MTIQQKKIGGSGGGRGGRVGGGCVRRIEVFGIIHKKNWGGVGGGGGGGWVGGVGFGGE